MKDFLNPHLVRKRNSGVKETSLLELLRCRRLMQTDENLNLLETDRCFWKNVYGI
jgi:hypothetical protein